MDHDFKWACFWAFVVIVVAAFISGLVYQDRNLEKFMAEKGLCYTTTDRTNSGPTFQWKKCQ